MLGIRWTIGDVSPRGFEALALSLWGAWRIFGASAAYRATWLHEQFLDGGLAEGVAWKLAPIRCFPDGRHFDQLREFLRARVGV